MIRIKRIYDAPSADDGLRILVDRLWPRGASKAKAKVDLWMKDIAPSDGLRKWFGHEPAKWDVFQTRYQGELRRKRDLLNRVRSLEAANRTVTLVYAAADQLHNNAVVLSEVLRRKNRRG